MTGASYIKHILFLIAAYFPASNALAQAFTFSFTGTFQTYKIPEHVKSIAVDITGASGGSSFFSRGGYGGRVQCTLAVTPGEILIINIGGAGKKATEKKPGGYNGGSPDREDMAGGGGASDIRVGGTELSNRIIVAGGGGGASYHFNKKDSERGGGGGPTGSQGYYNGDHKSYYSGGGGTVKRGGAGADGDYYVGLPGISGTGGAGAWYYCGGGGGGGYFGGGGGSMGGGGGGSSYTDANKASAVVHTQSFNQEGDGKLTIRLHHAPRRSGALKRK